MVAFQQLIYQPIETAPVQTRQLTGLTCEFRGGGAFIPRRQQMAVCSKISVSNKKLMRSDKRRERKKVAKWEDVRSVKTVLQDDLTFKRLGRFNKLQ